jgi:molybdopterin converting factor small subunit
MSMVKVKYRGELQSVTGLKEETVEAPCVKDVLDCIKTRHGGAALKAAKSMLIVINGESILLRQRYRTLLKDGDELSFLPICGGG